MNAPPADGGGRVRCSHPGRRSGNIDAPDAHDGFAGWAVGVQEEAVATLNKVHIDGAHQAAVFADQATVTLSKSTIQNTKAIVASDPGRGVHAQNGSSLTVIDSDFLNNKETAIFALDLSFLELDGILIRPLGGGDGPAPAGAPAGQGEPAVQARAGDRGPRGADAVRPPGRGPRG